MSTQRQYTQEQFDAVKNLCEAFGLDYGRTCRITLDAARRSPDDLPGMTVEAEVISGPSYYDERGHVMRPTEVISL